MKVLKSAYQIINIFVNLTAFLSTISLILYFIQQNIQNISDIRVIIIGSLLFTGIIIILGSHYRNLIKNYLNIREKRLIEEKSVIQVDESLPQKVTPSSQFVKLCYKNSIEEASNWDKAALPDIFSLHINVDNKIIDYKTQSYFYSTWKNTWLIIFRGKYMSKNMFQQEGLLKPARKKIPFFQEYKNWDIAVEQCYKKLKDKVRVPFRIAIGSHRRDSQMNNRLWINIYHKQGQVDMTESFEMNKDGNILYEKTGESEKIDNNNLTL